MPQGRLLRLGLGIMLLLSTIACNTERLRSLLLLQGDEPQATSPFAEATPPFGEETPPFGEATLAPPDLSPPTVVEPTATATQSPPTITPKPPPTPLPTATPEIPLELIRQTPAPTTLVLGHGLGLPAGFQIALYARDLPTASSMVYSPDGVLFVSLPGRGAVVAMAEAPGKSEPERMEVFAQGLTNPTGLAFHEGYLYVAETQQVVRFPYMDGQLGAAGSAEAVVKGLPLGPGVTNHAIGFGPDGKLYVSVGASCDACRETDYRRATIMRYDADGSHEEIFAQGLRDVEGLIWYPNSNQLLATNCSRRLMGDDLPPDTIEFVYAGANYGWPFCHAGDLPDPDLGWPEACQGVPSPFQQVPAQTAPRGLCAYTGSQFPAEYDGDIFVALSGSWERRVPVGYKIIRLDVENGEVARAEDFCTGWLVQGLAWGRPADVIQASDGSLLVSDDRAGAIYRIYYGK